MSLDLHARRALAALLFVIPLSAFVTAGTAQS